MDEFFGGRFYWNYFQAPGVADAELPATFRRLRYGLSGDTTRSDPPIKPLVPPGQGFLA